MSTWNEENHWYVRLVKLSHELAMEGRGEHEKAPARRPRRTRERGGDNPIFRWMASTFVLAAGLKERG